MHRETVEFMTTRPEETFLLGKRLSDFLNAGDVVSLYGELGCGKTIMAKGICEGLDVSDIVTSPTFALVQEYTGKVMVFHFDFYRLQSPEEVENLDIDGYFERGGISLIEWPEIAEPFLPEEHVSVHIEQFFTTKPFDNNKRQIQITGFNIGALKETIF